MLRGLKDPWLAGTIFLAAALRLYGIDHGLPHVYNPDEVNIMARSLAVAQSPDPNYYLYPSLLFYLLFGLMGAMFLAGSVAGRYDSLEAFQSLFFRDPSDFFLVGRLFGVACGLLTIGLTYSLALKHFGKNVARVAAMFLAVCFHHVRDAHYVKHDVPAGMVVILALIAIDRAMERKTRGAYVAAGLVLGIGFALHYYMIFLAVAMTLCHIATHRSKALIESGKLIGAGLASAFAFFLLSPFVLLRFGLALEHMGANRRVVVDRSVEAGSFFPSLPSYLAFMLDQGYGYVWCLFILIGAWGLVRRGWLSAFFWFGFAVPFMSFISYTFFAGRYLNPVVPVIAVAAAYGIDVLAKQTNWKLASMVALIACLQPLYLSVQMGRLFATEDTRSVARAWVLRNIAPGGSIATQSYSVPLTPTAESLRRALDENGALSELERRGKYSFLLEVSENATPTYEITFLGNGDEKDRRYLPYERFDAGLSVLRGRDSSGDTRGVDYVILRYPPQELPSALTTLFELVKREGTLAYRADPFAETSQSGRTSPVPPYLDNEDWPAGRHLRYRGPIIEIWRVSGQEDRS